MHPVPLGIGAARYVAALAGYLQIVMPMQNAIMDTDVTIDERGRLVLQKRVRDALGLRAGDRLKIRRQGTDVILSFSQANPVLREEKGVSVYRSGQSNDTALPDLIDQERRRRKAELS